MSPTVSVNCLWCFVGGIFFGKRKTKRSEGEREAQKAREDHCHFLLVVFTFSGMQTQKAIISFKMAQHSNSNHDIV